MVQKIQTAYQTKDYVNGNLEVDSGLGITFEMIEKSEVETPFF